MLVLFLFSRVCDGDLLVNVIIMMLHNMLSPVSLIAEIAYEQVCISDTDVCLNFSLPRLFRVYSPNPYHHPSTN